MCETINLIIHTSSVKCMQINKEITIEDIYNKISEIYDTPIKYFYLIIHGKICYNKENLKLKDMINIYHSDFILVHLIYRC